MGEKKKDCTYSTGSSRSIWCTNCCKWRSQEKTRLLCKFLKSPCSYLSLWLDYTSCSRWFGCTDMLLWTNQQTKVKQAVGMLKPELTHDSSATAIAAVQELEELSVMDLNAPLREEAVQHQPPPPPTVVVPAWNSTLIHRSPLCLSLSVCVFMFDDVTLCFRSGSAI